MGCTTHLEEIDAGYREDKVSVPEFSLRDPAKTQHLSFRLFPIFVHQNTFIMFLVVSKPKMFKLNYCFFLISPYPFSLFSHISTVNHMMVFENTPATNPTTVMKTGKVRY